MDMFCKLWKNLPLFTAAVSILIVLGNFDGNVEAIINTSDPKSKSKNCESCKYGCCLDGVTEAMGENFEECDTKPKNLQGACKLLSDKGMCRNFTIKWFYDVEYSNCARFWYGGCGGNENRFDTLSDCNDACLEPQGNYVCEFPKIKIM